VEAIVLGRFPLDWLLLPQLDLILVHLLLDLLLLGLDDALQRETRWLLVVGNRRVIHGRGRHTDTAGGGAAPGSGAIAGRTP